VPAGVTVRGLRARRVLPAGRVARFAAAFGCPAVLLDFRPETLPVADPIDISLSELFVLEGTEAGPPCVTGVSLDFFDVLAIYFSFRSAKPSTTGRARKRKTASESGGLGMRHFVFRWAITTVAVMVAASFISGIRYDSAGSLIGAALLLGILNAFLRPVLLLLAAPLIILTLGLFIFVVNGLMLLLVHQFVHGFHVDSFGSAFWGAILISLVSWMLSAFFRGSDGRVHPITHHTEIRQVKGRVVGSSKPGQD